MTVYIFPIPKFPCEAEFLPYLVGSDISGSNGVAYTSLNVSSVADSYECFVYKGPTSLVLSLLLRSLLLTLSFPDGSIGGYE